MAHTGKIRGKVPATIVVAASNSSYKGKRAADYVCPGTDDLDYITTTIFPLLPANGGTVVLLDGTYYMDTDNAGLLFPHDGVTVTGQGYGTLLTTSSSSVDGAIVNGKEFSYLTISNLRIKGNLSATTNYGFYSGTITYYGAYYNLFDNVVFETCKYGIYIDCRGVGIKVSDCTFMSNEYDYFTLYHTGTQFNNCYHSSTYGVWIHPNFQGSGVTFNNCYYYVQYISGMTTSFLTNCIIGNANTTETCGTYNYCTLTNCRIIGLSAGIVLGDYNSVNGCSFSSYTGFRGGTSKAISVTGTNNSIVGNRFADDYYAPTGLAYHIYLEAASTKTIVKDNIFLWSALTADFADAGTANTNNYFEGEVDAFSTVAACNSGAIDTVILTSGTPVAITLTAADQPDVPRNLTAFLRDPDASISGITLSVTGYDAKGVMWTDSYTTASGAQARAWATLCSASVTSVYGESSGDVLYVGYGQKLGLSGMVSMSSDVYRVSLNGTPITTSGYSVNASYDTVDISGLALNDTVLVHYRKNTNHLKRS